MPDSRPIGIFDSGLGGLTVVDAINRKTPNENIIYVGDTARVPYGNKSAPLIIKYASQITKFLLEKNYLVEDRFTVTDIIVSWTINWGRRQGLLENMEGLNEYLKRLFKRQNCALAKD